jgi:hypothetical protein
MFLVIGQPNGPLKKKTIRTFTHNQLIWICKKVRSLKVYNKVIHKIKKTQHQNPKFGHKQGEIKKKITRKKLAFNQG